MPGQKLNQERPQTQVFPGVGVFGSCSSASAKRISMVLAQSQEWDSDCHQGRGPNSVDPASLVLSANERNSPSSQRRQQRLQDEGSPPLFPYSHSHFLFCTLILAVPMATTSFTGYYLLVGKLVSLGRNSVGVFLHLLPLPLPDLATSLCDGPSRKKLFQYQTGAWRWSGL